MARCSPPFYAARIAVQPLKITVRIAAPLSKLDGSTAQHVRAKHQSNKILIIKNGRATAFQ
jgi:hypothetical protein